MKVLVIGDPHFKVDNILNVEKLHSQIEFYLLNNNVDLIVCLGDVLHTHEKIHVTPLNYAYKFILMLSTYAKTYVIVGNHDMVNNSQFLTTSHWMNAMKEWFNVVIVDTVTKSDNFIFVPYVPNGRFIEALNTIEDWKSAKVVFAHQELKGCKMGSIISVNGDEWKADYPFVISGHIHEEQEVGNNIFYPGSAMQHAFGDNKDKGFFIFEFINDIFTRQKVKLDLIKKVIIYLNFNNLNSGILKYTNTETTQYKVVISGDNPDKYKQFTKSKDYLTLTASGTRIIFKYKPESLEMKESNIDLLSFTSIFKELINKEIDSEKLMKMANDLGCI
jgi:DNA repair exonuclease SbcCD nuclease subunit